ncbi:hypothetical protein JCM9157_1813 [Halalkalibacter akibai JCM 9157]|uniref:Uncharacterized protein n=1 Tax=Halalkalibacter akibai (strain ATCC 43226 / DSM 21942 / CIP 109018 / JCM 9157 / 1139) TaxID=1236973 RepID=W4QRK9_HALA3|nr:hypothetical protein JCM9157_1813 [Halalkalibacter akibai JCM 9157]
MAIDRCADCGSIGATDSNGKECPYCERYLCPSCMSKQLKVYNWNGCATCCIYYRRLMLK